MIRNYSINKKTKITMAKKKEIADIDLGSMTRAKLAQYASALGVKVTTKHTKATIIENIQSAMEKKKASEKKKSEQESGIMAQKADGSSDELVPIEKLSKKDLITVIKDAGGTIVQQGQQIHEIDEENSRLCDDKIELEKQLIASEKTAKNLKYWNNAFIILIIIDIILWFVL